MTANNSPNSTTLEPTAQAQEVDGCKTALSADLQQLGAGKSAPAGTPANLMRTAARAISFSLSSQVGKLLIRLAAMVVMARLIRPADYGLFSLAFAVAVFGLIFKEGFGVALVQRKELSDADRDSLFWFTARLAVVSSLLTALAAPVAAIIYKNNDL
ncbi:MAG: oligosaccharide flippase family protein, partial [Terriglobales bacterium]